MATSAILGRECLTKLRQDVRTCHSIRSRKLLLTRASVRGPGMESHLAETKKELDRLLTNLGFPQTVLPGNTPAKSDIDKLLSRLEALNPVPTPLNWQQQQQQLPGALPGVCPLLLGEWDLVFASNGTVVTRTAPVQMLLGASRLPGVGLSDITQVLSLNDSGVLVASNTAVFGLGPLGGWQVGVQGAWKDAGDGQTARVLFDRFTVKPVSMMGLPAPSWLPPLKLTTGGAPSSLGEGRAGAQWTTTFLDEDLRIGRGASGNAFLFRRKRLL